MSKFQDQADEALDSIAQADITQHNECSVCGAAVKVSFGHLCSGKAADLAQLTAVAQQMREALFKAQQTLEADSRFLQCVEDAITAYDKLQGGA